MKQVKPIIVAVLIVVASMLQVLTSILSRAVTAVYNSTVRIVSSTGTVIGGDRFRYHSSLQLHGAGSGLDEVTSSIPFGGGGTTITSGAGDFGAATSQTGGVLTGFVPFLVPSTLDRDIESGLCR